MKIALLAAALLAAASSAASGPLVHGHRGCRARLPENTLAAFAEALRVGADVLELDLAVTKDGVLVVSHDLMLNPALCLGPDGKPAAQVPIRTLTLAQVKEHDCGTLKNPRFLLQSPRPGERVPTLEEVFALVESSTAPAAKTIQFNVETKTVPGLPDLTPAPEQFSRLVVSAVRRRGMTSRVILQSFDDRTLLAARKLEPKLRRSLLTSDNHIDYAAAAKAAGASIISPDALWITFADVKALHAKGLQVAPWTVNDARGWDLLIAAGVDAIITDDPEALIAHLKSRGLR